eukprot:scpid46107/ scgid12747/ 
MTVSFVTSDACAELASHSTNPSTIPSRAVDSIPPATQLCRYISLEEARLHRHFPQLIRTTRNYNFHKIFLAKSRNVSSAARIACQEHCRQLSTVTLFMCSSRLVGSLNKYCDANAVARVDHATVTVICTHFMSSLQPRRLRQPFFSPDQ